MPNSRDLKSIADKLRRHSILMTTEAGSGHPTSCMSCADIISVLFFSEMNWDPQDHTSREYDLFVLSKGHAAPILYAALKEAGAIQNENLLSLRQFGSILEGHPSVKCPFIKVATGSLGQGLSAACGMAIARQKDNKHSLVYCLMGDGETQEGSVWEAANFAGKNKLSNLVAIVDVNRLGQSSPTMFEHDLEGYSKRFSSFGWNPYIVDGHNIDELISAFSKAKQSAPAVIIAKTYKGKGATLIENTDSDHGKPVPKDKLNQVLSTIPDSQIDCKISPKIKRTSNEPVNNPNIAIDLPYKIGDQVATREAYGLALKELGKNIKNLYVLDADVKNSTFSDKFANEFPDRFIQTYIAEQNMAGIGLGLAVEGKIVTLSSFACFLTRAFDFFRMGAYSRPAHYIVCGSHAGVSIGEDGPSQMGLEDIAMMKSIADSTVVYPSDAVSSAKLTAELTKVKGISYIRTTRPKTRVIYDKNEKFPVGGSKTLVTSSADKATIIGCGITLHEALKAHEELKAQGISTRIIDLYSIKPLDRSSIIKAIDDTSFILTCEDHYLYGGIGDEVAKVVASHGKPCKFVMLGVSGIQSSGSQEELMKHNKIDYATIVQTVLKYTNSHAVA